ncbi:CLUMA_CG004742, isoform A [Clunio marinus]|uniref:CLUMA_CG004742, isoform A n=1 Tax=Clunio marinus TaxID=568069 RepID=A0A1J1HX03_9DIPT|nr:CLUMA_CG004742, isoform A [Clunio marinus]
MRFSTTHYGKLVPSHRCTMQKCSGRNHYARMCNRPPVFKKMRYVRDKERYANRNFPERNSQNNYRQNYRTMNRYQPYDSFQRGDNSYDQ